MLKNNFDLSRPGMRWDNGTFEDRFDCRWRWRPSLNSAIFLHFFPPTSSKSIVVFLRAFWKFKFWLHVGFIIKIQGSEHVWAALQGGGQLGQIQGEGLGPLWLFSERKKKFNIKTLVHGIETKKVFQTILVVMTPSFIFLKRKTRQTLPILNYISIKPSLYWGCTEPVVWTTLGTTCGRC